MLILEGDDKTIYVDDVIEFVLEDDDVDFIYADNENTPCTVAVPSMIINTLQMIDDDQFVDSLMNIDAGYTSKRLWGWISNPGTCAIYCMLLHQ